MYCHPMGIHAMKKERNFERIIHFEKNTEGKKGAQCTEPVTIASVLLFHTQAKKIWMVGDESVPVQPRRSHSIKSNFCRRRVVISIRGVSFWSHP
mmetsp:Transcript_5404/g.11992  ORF Transcript_5404/g.11992 Transcript_5404/m.11992 type:complete len:95 (+) Transcript_5404:48-332(+)